MDLKGSLVDTNLKIYPSSNLTNYLKTITLDDEAPENIVKLVKGVSYEKKKQKADTKPFNVHLNEKDLQNLNKIKEAVDKSRNHEKETCEETSEDATETKKDAISDSKEDNTNDESVENKDKDTKHGKQPEKRESELHITTSDIDWLYLYLQTQKNKGTKDVPYLHYLLEGASVEMPENQVIKRNPILEARCVKLRAQQEAREYRKMTKSVDNVRMRFPEDSISYQLKQVNRHLIAIGQFIISIFAGFLFGFKGVEWMIGELDFGFRLLLGVICALVISLAEIYFLAKKLNEELSIPETVQLGGPVKFANQPSTSYAQKTLPKEDSKASLDKEHQD